MFAPAKELTTVTAKMIIYQAFIESELEVQRHLARRVRDLYLSPQNPEFEPRTVWSLFECVPIGFQRSRSEPQFRATAILGSFLDTCFKRSS